MLIYIIIFLISFIFAYQAEKKLKKGRKKQFYILSIISIVIPSLLAGLRASGIGTDTKVYIDWVFRESVYAENISDIIEFINYSGIEPLYCLVNFVVSRFSNNLSSIYFVLEFIFLFFSYFACVKMSKKINISFSYSYLVLLLLFFNKSLNMCRQSLAMSVCLFSVPYILSRDWKKFFLSMVVAFCFHKSVVLFVPLYFIYNITTKDTRTNKVIRILILGLLLVCAIFFKKIVVFGVSLGVLSSKYLNYVYLFGSGNNIKAIELFSEIAILLMTLLFQRKLKSKSEYNKFLIYVIILSFVTFLFGFNASYSQRISYFYSFCLAFVIPQFSEIFRLGKDRLFASVLITLALCCYSYLYYDMYQFDQTVPYITDTSTNKIIK